MNLLQDFQEAKVSILKNPFKADNLGDIDIHLSQSNFNDNPYWWSTIEFRNGKTTGTQEFEVPGADGLPELLRQMDEFLKSLTSTTGE